MATADERDVDGGRTIASEAIRQSEKALAVPDAERVPFATKEVVNHHVSLFLIFFVHPGFPGKAARMIAREVAAETREGRGDAQSYPASRSHHARTVRYRGPVDWPRARRPSASRTGSSPTAATKR